MLRLIALGDLHINGLDLLSAYMRDPNDVIYKTLDGVCRYAHRHGIRYIFQLGDAFHGPNPTQAEQTRLLDFIERSGLKWFFQLGNHDILENNKHSLITTDFVSTKLKNDALRVFTKPTQFVLEGIPICILPWPHNKTLLTTPGLTFAHITLKGARLDSGMNLKKGAEIEGGKNGYWWIGDVHGEQRIGNWAHYVGTPYQRTFGEHLPKGFCDATARIENGKLFVKDRFIVQKPPYELVNLIIENDADLEKMKPYTPKDLTLYKLRVRGGYELPGTFRKNNPHVYDVDYGRANRVSTVKASPEAQAIRRKLDLDNPLHGLHDLLGKFGLSEAEQAQASDFAEKMVETL